MSTQKYLSSLVLNRVNGRPSSPTLPLLLYLNTWQGTSSPPHSSKGWSGLKGLLSRKIPHLFQAPSSAWLGVRTDDLLKGHHRSTWHGFIRVCCPGKCVVYWETWWMTLRVLHCSRCRHHGWTEHLTLASPTGARIWPWETNQYCLASSLTTAFEASRK